MPDVYRNGVNRFYFKGSTSNTDWTALDSPTHKLCFIGDAFMIVNDGDEGIQWSFDGIKIDGEICPEDKVIAFDGFFGNCKVWLRSPTGVSVNYRLWSWLKQR